jgi:hypothetical protein
MRCLLIAMILTLSSAGAALAAGCGTPPAAPKPPVGCSSLQPTCICDASGACRWNFVCVRE